jgi:hypothetical protein
MGVLIEVPSLQFAEALVSAYRGHVDIKIDGTVRFQKFDDIPDGDYVRVYQRAATLAHSEYTPQVTYEKDEWGEITEVVHEMGQ